MLQRSSIRGAASTILAVAFLGLAPSVCGAQEEPAAEPTTVAVFHLAGELLETEGAFSLHLGAGPDYTHQGLLKRLRQAAEDESLPAVVFTFDEPVMSWAQMQELRGAMQQLRRSGKQVHCYAEEVNQLTYQLATAATRIVVAPAGGIGLTGLHLENPYLKGLLDKVGLQADIVHMGDYKSAGEPLTRTGPSDEARAMLNWILDDLYAQMVSTIAEGRGLSDEQVRQLIDQGPYNAPQALEAGLVDAILDADGFVESLQEEYPHGLELVRDYGEEEGPDIDFSSPFAFFKLLGQSMSKSKKAVKHAIALIHVDGPIVDGEPDPGLWGGQRLAGSTTLRRVLSQAREDESVKAVVLRVSSPGGSALASDIIWQAARDVSEVKPLVVSMGAVAASGGYYVAVSAPTIFADAATITGSIGVIGGKLVTKGLWDWVGISTYESKRGRNADLYSMQRPFTEDQRAMMLEQLQFVYDLFRQRVTAGRQGRLHEDLDALAGGRIFTGRQAMEKGLVDRVGSLDDAIAFAADQADITDYELRLMPESRSFLDLFMEGLTGKHEDEEEQGLRLSADGRTAALRGLFRLRGLEELIGVIRQVDPVRARAILSVLAQVELLRTENVLLSLPYAWTIR